MRLAGRFFMALCATPMMLAASLHDGRADETQKTQIPALSADAALHAMLPEAIQKAGVIKLATDAQYPPCESFAEDGKTMVGWEPDIWNAMAQKLGVKLEASSIAFAGLIPGVQSKRFDMAMECMADTVEREKTVTFINVAYILAGVVALEGDARITADPATLCGLRVGGQEGTTHIDNVKNLLNPLCVKQGKPEIQIVNFPSASAAQVALYSNRVDFITYELIGASELKRKAPKPIKVIPMDIFPRKYNGMIVDKENTQLAEALLAALKAVHKEGVYDLVMKKWDIEAIKLDEPGINLTTTRPLKPAQ